MSELHKLTARAALDLLRRGEVTPLEMIDAAARRIEATDGEVGALPTLCLDRARDHARRLMASKSSEEEASPWLAGLPIAVKDLVEVAGVRTTWGSPIFAEVSKAFQSMTETPEGRAALKASKFAAFPPATDAVFDNLRAVLAEKARLKKLKKKKK